MSKKTAPKTALVTFLLDRSGSMAAIYESTIEAFNGYLDGLKKDRSILFSLVQFDSGNTQPDGSHCRLEKTCIAVEAEKAPELSRENYQPNGGTPLIEAATKIINATAEKAGKDNQVVICIQTDGDENSSSREYTWDSLKKLITEKQALGWQFNFMGAGIDAYQQGARMGLSSANTMSYDSADAGKTRAAFAGRGVNTSLYAAGAVADMSISASEKHLAGDKFDPALKKPVPVRPEPFKL